MMLWMTLALQAGTINVGGFLACHRFVTHTTGFATFFASDLVEFKWMEALGMLCVPLFFMLGSMISGFFVDRRIILGERPHYSLILSMIAMILWIVVLTGANGLLGQFGRGLAHESDYFLLICLCLASGIQNAVISSASQSTIRTTHLTGISTDLAIGIIRMLSSTHLISLKKELEGTAMRVGIIFSFVLGSVIGAILFTQFKYLGFTLPALISTTLWAMSIQTQNQRKIST